eukprot:IDg19045t1
MHAFRGSPQPARTHVLVHVRVSGTAHSSTPSQPMTSPPQDSLREPPRAPLRNSRWRSTHSSAALGTSRCGGSTRTGRAPRKRVRRGSAHVLRRGSLRFLAADASSSLTQHGEPRIVKKDQARQRFRRRARLADAAPRMGKQLSLRPSLRASLRSFYGHNFKTLFTAS